MSGRPRFGSDDPRPGAADRARPAAVAARPHPDRARLSAIAFGLVLGAVVALLAAFAWGLRGPATGPRIGEAAPAFDVTTYEGEPISSASLHGEVVVLNFWASWCVECVYEAADLEAVWQDYRHRGVTVLGLAYTDTRPAALDYLSRHAVTYPNAPDAAGTVSRRYALTGVPETVVIDREGRVAPLQRRGAPQPVPKLIGPITPGASFTPTDLRALLDRLVAAQEP